MHSEIEAAAEGATTTMKKAALGLFGDVSRTGDVMARLNKFGHWAGDAFKSAKEGTHGSYKGDLAPLFATRTTWPRRSSSSPHEWRHRSRRGDA